ncbi:(2Fe-2S)-binding protein [Streptomyces monomycini]|uniref:(2Fe-2S)-binding protein n=1 Tax=Streptomyces monomycini TaxID=371720 RepID=UPI0004ABC099|nr:(2Fe-2S)-binding protein [Streptomyces monomycini]
MTEDSDPLICVCAHVRESEIVAAVARGCRDLAAVREATSANTGCGDCCEDVEEVMEYARA